MTIPSHFSLWRHLSRTQIALSIVTGLLAAVIAILVLSVYVNILATNSAFQGGYIITDLTDIQRAILRLHNESVKVLSMDPIDFGAVDLERALLNSQLRLARTESTGNEDVAVALDQLQEMLDSYDSQMVELRANPTAEQVATVIPALDELLTDLENRSKNFNNREENQFFSTISTALRTQRSSQTGLLILSGLLVLFSTVLIFSLRRTVKDEFNRAYHLLEDEVIERKLTEVKLRSANEHLQSLNSRLQSELDLAREIQQSLLPPPCPDWSGLDVACHMTPAYEVGGDFYAYHELDEDRFTLAVGDVSGKGLAAALLMATTLAHFDSIFAFALSPSDLLAQLDETLLRYTRTSHQNCALCYVELSGMTLTVTNAGGIPPYIRRLDGGVETLDVRGLPLGIGLGLESGYQALTVTLAPGDLVILTSDGVVEAGAASHKLFSFDRLERTVASGPTSSAQAMLDHVKSEVSAFTGGADPHDDLTIVVFQVKA